MPKKLAPGYEKPSDKLQSYYDRGKSPEAKKKKEGYHKDWWAKNKDILNTRRRNITPEQRKHRQEMQREWVRKNPHKKILTGAKGRAKQKGLDFNLTEEDILPLPTHCPILGLKLNYSAKVNAPNGYSLDRTDNTKGYVKGNVMIISFRANILKRDATFEELSLLGRWAQAQQEKEFKL